MTLRSGIELHLHRLSLMSPGGFFFALHIRFALPLLHHQTYPPEWTDRYTEEAFALRDPIIAWGFSTTGTARWSEITIPDPFDILGQAREFGMIYGFAVACGPIKSRTIASASRSDREFTDAEISPSLRITIVSEDWYQGLSDADRATVDAAAEAANKANRDWLGSQGSVYDKLKEAGVSIVELGDAEREEFRKASETTYLSLLSQEQFDMWKAAKGN